MEPEVKNGFWTSEFWVAIAAKAGAAAIGLAVLFGKDSTDASALGVAVEKGLAAVGTLVVIGWTAHGYIRGRSEVKVAASEARAVEAAANRPVQIVDPTRG
jgi:hypothetical protein